MERISYAKYLASPQYRKFPFNGLIGWIVGNFPLSVEDLQSKYDFAYYSTMVKAVTDVNNGTIANADAQKANAVAGVYTDENGGKNVVLLKDHTESERIEPSVDMTINLGGHVLSTQNKIAVAVMSGNVMIDGRLQGSTVRNIQAGNVRASAIVTVAPSSLHIVGGTYHCIGESLPDNHGAIVVSDYCDIQNATVKIECQNGFVYGVRASQTARISISNCNIDASVVDGKAFGLYVYEATVNGCNIRVSANGSTGNSTGILNNGGEATVTNCDIRAYSNYTNNETGESYYGEISVGVINAGTVNLNNCHVFGTHSGISNHGTLCVNGGTYEGYGHGGFYFSNSDAVSYVRNATIRDCDMPDGYTATANRNGAGFYFGDCANGQVYMDNCEINGIAASQIFVIKGSDNTLYISNSTVNNTNGGDANIRIDDGGNMLYIGRGNNFTADNTNRPGAVIVTDEVYVQGVA